MLEAVRAEAFNPATLFLFGSYTIGKERLFLEVARILKRKVCLQSDLLVGGMSALGHTWGQSTEMRKRL